MSCDIDEVDEHLAVKLFNLRYVTMGSEIKELVERFLTNDFDFSVVENVFESFLKLFQVSLDDLLKYLKHSLPAGNSLGNTLWAFVPCKCAKESCYNFIVKKVDLFDDAYCINFNEVALEIIFNTDHDQRNLTHLFINLLKVHESKWTKQNSSILFKHHRIAAILSLHFKTQKKRKIIISSSEDEDEEKENIFDKTKKKYQKIKASRIEKAPKVIQNIEKNYVNLCKTAMASYFKEKEALEKTISKCKYHKPQLDFTEDQKNIQKSFNDLSEKKLAIDNCELFRLDSSSLYVEAEALHKIF